MKLSTWAEVLGIIALVVSLVFVGVEVRHSTAATSAQALLNLNDAMNEILRSDALNYSFKLDPAHSSGKKELQMSIGKSKNSSIKEVKMA